MRFARLTLILILSVSLMLACQTTSPSNSAPQATVTQPASPGSIPGEDSTQTSPPTLSLDDTNPAGDSTPTLASPFPQEDTNMTPITPPDEAAGKLVTLVKQHLAQQLGIPADQIVLGQVRSVVWRDAGLGCPKPGVDYIQVETPGYTISLEAGGKTYNYHTDATRRFVPCNK
jgi:hypothetical protein